MKIRTIPQTVKLSAIAGMLVFLVVACGGKLSQENFDKVTNGMPANEVKSLLGEPSKVDSATLPVLGTVTTFTYKTDKGEATVVFRDNKVQTKAGSISQ